MELTEYKEVIKKQSVIIGYKCDNCGKIHKEDYFPNNWHKFEATHNSWGNDGCDSYEYYMACSIKCYINLIKIAIKDFASYSNAKIDNFTIDFAILLITSFDNFNNK
jgi:hypothetical protein